MTNRPLHLSIAAFAIASLATGQVWSAEDAAALTKDADAAKATAKADYEKAQADLKDAATLEAKAREEMHDAEVKEREAEIASGMTKDQLLAEDLRRKGEGYEKASKAELADAERKEATLATQNKEIADLDKAVADAKGKSASADQVKLLDDVLADDKTDAKNLGTEIARLKEDAKKKAEVAKKFDDEAKKLAAKSATPAATK
jgi:hypothetical protein